MNKHPFRVVVCPKGVFNHIEMGRISGERHAIDFAIALENSALFSDVQVWHGPIAKGGYHVASVCAGSPPIVRRSEKPRSKP